MKLMQAHRQPHAHRVEVYAPRYELALFPILLVALLLAVVLLFGAPIK